jgi:hypothetical protein
MDGTSMAAPHIAGFAALYLEKYNKDPQKIKQFQYHLLNTAEPMYESSEGQGDLMTVIRQGGGVVKPHRLLDVEDYISPRKLELGKIKDQKQVHEQQITIHNKGKTAKTYALKHAPAVAINLQNLNSPIKELGAHAKVSFQQSEVTIPAQGSVQVKVSIDSGALFRKENLFYSGYIQVVDKATKEILRVPYMGYSGDKSEVKILQQPKLFHVRDNAAQGPFTDDTSSALKPAFQTRLTYKDYVMFDYKLQLPTSLLVIAVVKASDPKTDVQVIKRMQLTFTTPPPVDNKDSEFLSRDAIKIVNSISERDELPANENYRIKVTAHTSQTEPDEWLSPVFHVLP